MVGVWLGFLVETWSFPLARGSTVDPALTAVRRHVLARYSQREVSPLPRPVRAMAWLPAHPSPIGAGVILTILPNSSR